MGLLFVHEGDHQSVGPHVDISLRSWTLLFNAAKAQRPGSSTLVRRLNDFYRDVLFESDELPGLLSEMERIAVAEDSQHTELLEFLRNAISAGVGVETIAD